LPIKSFDFAKGRTVDLDRRRAIFAEAEADDENTTVLIHMMKELKIQIIGKATEERQVEEMVRKFHTGMLFLDIGNTRIDAFALLARVRRRYPEMSVILTSKEANKEVIAKSIKYGAAGFLLIPYQRDAVAKLVDRLD